MIKDIDFRNFQSFINDRLVVIYYWAEWCISCQSQKSILVEIEKELLDLTSIGQININDNRFIADQQKVKNIPTLVIYKNGIEAERFTGLHSKQEIIQNIKKYTIL